MDPQLSIGTLLSAARLIEMGTLNNVNPTSDVATAASNLFDLSNESELRSLFCGKLKFDKKNVCAGGMGSASTSSHPYCTSPNSRKISKHSRAAHNELEKTRRANLRGCLEQLRHLVPSISDVARNTTLALLTRARDHILELKEANIRLKMEREKKDLEREALLAELAQLEEETSMSTQSSSRPESRASTTSSTSSTPSSRDSPYFLEYSPSTKPSMVESPKSILIDPIAEGLLPAVPLTYPRPIIYPQNVLDLIQLQSTTTKFDVLNLLPINLRV